MTMWHRIWRRARAFLSSAFVRLPFSILACLTGLTVVSLLSWLNDHIDSVLPQIFPPIMQVLIETAIHLVIYFIMIFPLIISLLLLLSITQDLSLLIPSSVSRIVGNVARWLWRLLLLLPIWSRLSALWARIPPIPPIRLPPISKKQHAWFILTALMFSIAGLLTYRLTEVAGGSPIFRNDPRNESKPLIFSISTPDPLAQMTLRSKSS
jgi:hypothetical protein